MTTGRRIAYAMGSFANTLCEQARNRVLFFYNHEAGLPATFTSIVWGIFGVWNAINDPLMGQVTDRARTRWGRRIPFILFGAIPLGLSFLLLWTPPAFIRLKQAAAGPAALAGDPGWRPLLLSLYMFLALFIFDAIYTLVIMAYNALYTEMTETPKDRARLGAWREGLGVIALIFAIALMPELIHQIGWVGTAAVFGAAAAGGYLLSLLGASEDKAFSQQPVAEGFVESIRIALANVPFRFHLGANICKEMIFTVPVAMLPYYCRYAIDLTPIKVRGVVLDADVLEGLLLGIPFLLVLPSLLLWTFVTPRIGARASWILSFVSFIPGTFLMTQVTSYPLALLGTCSLAPGLAGLMMLPHILISEIIDQDALAAGKRREGVFYGINGAAVKLAVTIHSILFGIVFQAAGFINPTDALPEPVQPEAAVNGIRFLMGGVPAIVSVIGTLLLLMVRFPRSSPNSRSRLSHDLAESAIDSPLPKAETP